MAISFVNKSTFASGTGALTVAAVASVAAGDLILLFVESANENIATPSGFTQVTGSPVSTGTAAAAGGVRLGVFYRYATGADTTTSVADSGNHTTAIKMAFRGVDQTSPFDGTPVTGIKTPASTSSSFPGITTSYPNSWIVHASALDLDAASTATTGAATNANLTSITERHDQTVASGVGGGLVVITGTKATAGATGNTTATVTSTVQVYMTLALAEPQIRLQAAATCRSKFMPNAVGVQQETILLRDGISGDNADTAGWVGDRFVYYSSSAFATYYTDDFSTFTATSGTVGGGATIERVIISGPNNVGFSNIGTRQYYPALSDASTWSAAVSVGSDTTMRLVGSGSDKYFLLPYTNGVYRSATGASGSWTFISAAAIGTGTGRLHWQGGSRWIYFRSGANPVESLDDGDTWTTFPTDPANGSSLFNVAYGNGLYVITSGSNFGRQVRTSTDTTTWTSSAVIPLTGTSAAIDAASLHFYEGYFYLSVTWTDSGTSDRGYIIYRSADGVTWTAVDSFTTNTYTAVLRCSQRAANFLAYNYQGVGTIRYSGAIELGSSAPTTLDLGTASGTATSTATSALTTQTLLASSVTCRTSIKNTVIKRAHPNAAYPSSTSARLFRQLNNSLFAIGLPNAARSNNGFSWQQVNTNDLFTRFDDTRNVVVEDTLFYLPANATEFEFAYTTNGSNWTSVPAVGGYYLTGIAWSGSRWVARRTNGTAAMFHGTTLGTWSAVALSGSWQFSTSPVSPAYMVGWAGAGTPATQYLSDDGGQTWTAFTYNPGSAGSVSSAPLYAFGGWWACSTTSGRVWNKPGDDPTGVWNHNVISGLGSVLNNLQFINGKLRGYVSVTSSTVVEWSTADGSTWESRTLLLNDARTASFVSGITFYKEGYYYGTNSSTDIGFLAEAPYIDTLTPIFADVFSTTTATGTLLEAGLTASVSVTSTATADLTLPITFAASVAALTTATSALTTSIRLNAALTATSTATGALTTTIRLNAAVAAATTTTGAITTAIQLASSRAATSTATGALTVGALLSANAAAVASTTAALTTPILFSADAISSTATTAALTTAIQANGALTAVSTATAALQVGVFFAASRAASTTATAALTTQVRLNGALAATTTSTSALTTQVRLTTAVNATTSTTAALTTEIRLAASAVSAAATTADLQAGALLAASVQAATTTTGALTTQVLLAGAGQGTASATAALTVGVQLSASGVAASVASGALTVGVFFAATAAATTTATAALTTGENFSASATAAATASAALTTQTRFASAAVATTTATATLTGAAAALQASASSAAAAAAGITTAIRLNAAVAASASASATVVSQASFEASVTASATSAGALLVPKPLTAAVTSAASASADLTTVVSFSAQATATATTTAALTTQARFAAAAQASAQTSADLTVAKLLVASAAASASATAALTTQIALAGAVAASTVTAGAIDTQLRMNTSVAASASASADLFIAKLLEGAATVNASSEATLRVGVLLSATALAGTYTQADLETSIRFYAALLARVSTTGSLSQDLTGTGASQFLCVVPTDMTLMVVPPQTGMIVPPEQDPMAPPAALGLAVPPEPEMSTP